MLDLKAALPSIMALATPSLQSMAAGRRTVALPSDDEPKSGSVMQEISYRSGEVEKDVEDGSAVTSAKTQYGAGNQTGRMRSAARRARTSWARRYKRRWAGSKPGRCQMPDAVLKVMITMSKIGAGVE